MRNEHPLDDVARAQLGLVTISQLLGFKTRRQIDHDIGGGRLIPMRRGVYRMAGAPLGWRVEVLAANLAVPDSAVGHRCAGRVLGIPGVPSQTTELLVLRPSRPRIPGVRIHQSTLVPRHHLARLDAFTVTTAARTILDMSARLSPTTLARALRGAIRHELTTYEEVWQVRDELRARGRRRTTIIDALFEGRLPGVKVGDSEGEYRMLEWIAAAGLPLPQQQLWVVTNGGRYCLDHAYGPEKIDLEWDSELHERTPDDVEYDAVRDAELELAGWLVMRASRLTDRHAFVRRLDRALQQRSPHLHSA